MAIPTTTPFSQYSGLYLSCRTIRAEMDSECGKILKTYLYMIKDQMEKHQPAIFQFLRFTIPGTFLQMQHIRLDFSRCHHSGSFLVFRSFFKFAYLNRFASITFIIPENTDQAHRFLVWVHTDVSLCWENIGTGMQYFLDDILAQSIMDEWLLYEALIKPGMYDWYLGLRLHNRKNRIIFRYTKADRLLSLTF